MFSSHSTLGPPLVPVGTGTTRSSANLASRHANAYARDQPAPQGEVIFDEIMQVSPCHYIPKEAEVLPPCSVSTQPGTPSPIPNNSTATSPKDTTRSSPKFAFQGAPRRSLKMAHRKSRSATPASGEPSKVPTERYTPRRKMSNHVSAVVKGPSEAVRKPVSKPRKVKEYCTNCEERRANGRNKVHHCRDCQYVESETQTGAPGQHAPTWSPTPYRTSPTKFDKIYCEECTGRKHEPGNNGRSRKNAKHKCAECFKLRDEAASREGSRSQSQSQSQSVQAASGNGTGNFHSGSKQPRKSTNDKAATLSRQFVYRKAKVVPGALQWVYGGPDIRNADGDWEDDDGSGNETDENEEYNAQRIIPADNSHSAISHRRTQNFPAMLTRRDIDEGVWVPYFDPECLMTDFGPERCLEAKKRQMLQLYQRNGEPWSTTRSRMEPSWVVGAPPPSPDNDALDPNDGEDKSGDQPGFFTSPKPEARMPVLVQDRPPPPRTTSEARFQPWADANAVLYSSEFSLPPVDDSPSSMSRFV